MILASFQLGEGQRPTVLLHGFLGTGRNLRSLAAAWSAADPSRRFLLPDLTGHGTSPPLPPGATLSHVAMDVVETARAAGFEGPLEFVGHSIGGRVSLAASLATPGDVASVTLLDITPGPIPPGLSESGKVLEKLRASPARAADRKAMREELTGRGLSGPLSDWLLMNLEPAPEGGVRWRFDREALGEFHARVNGEQFWNALARPELPVRCIRGGRAAYVSDNDVARMEALGCPVDTLPNAGHFVHVDAPDELLRWLLRG
ncbi:alpha/beta fold hydrolase [Cystobacter fuscus]|uniref:alpha/beta fold hydrolase n=1 Tax=Cystobacter fuscus TaxID=43 RepID=UPI002B3210A3|nr:alpha/beta hydrolase [Cystobacter fuscus]